MILKTNMVVQNVKAPFPPSSYQPHINSPISRKMVEEMIGITSSLQVISYTDVPIGRNIVLCANWKEYSTIRNTKVN